MPTWRTPFALPYLTSAEFRIKKAEYIARYGYTIQIPGFEDIFRLTLEEPITEVEQIWWLAKDWDKFTPKRLDYLQKIKAKRKRQFLNMLGSPQPDVLQARSSILTAIDNAEDAMTTLQIATRVILRYLSHSARSAIGGPIGWFMAISDYMNLITQLATPERSALRTKRLVDEITTNNPKMRKLQYQEIGRRALKGLTYGTALETFQTTDQVFGYGISLGALMNFPYDIIAANVRSMEGAKVTILLPTKPITFWGKAAGIFMKSMAVIFTASDLIGAEDMVRYLLTTNLAQRVLNTFKDDWPHDEITDIVPYAEIQAPKPTNILLLEAITEAGDNPNLGVAWPALRKEWASCKEIYTTGIVPAVKQFTNYCKTNAHSVEAFLASAAAVEGLHFGIEALGGSGSVQYDYTSWCKTFHALLNAGYRLPYYLNRISETEPRGKIWYKDDVDISNLRWLENKYKQIFTDSPVVRLTAMMRRYQWMGTSEGFFFKPYHVALDTAQSKITEYLASHEENNSTPSTPIFMNYLKDNFGIILPMNETIDTHEESPTIYLP